VGNAIEIAAHDRHIVDAAASKVFEGSLGSYTRKEDLVGLARALEIVDSDTIPELKEHIKGHLQQCPELENNDRFKALFGRRRAAPRNNAPPPPNSITATLPD
jgi:hypothetical protein